MPNTLQDHGLTTQSYQAVRSPLYPQTTLSTDERLAMYNHKYGIEEQSPADVGETFNPYVPAQKDSPNEDEHLSNVDKWLAPVAVDTSTPEEFNKDEYDHFVDKVHSDPAIHDIYEAFQGTDEQPGLMPALFNAIQQGHMTYDEAMDYATQVMDEHFTPILDKHHGGEDRLTKERTLLKPEVSDADKYGITKQAIQGGI